jgi:predicted dehydrogenase
MAKHVRIGIVGAGFAAHFHLASYAKVYGEDFEIRGIYGRTKDKALHLAKDFKIPKVYDTYEQMLADKEIDVCDLVVANYMHIPLAGGPGGEARLLREAAHRILRARRQEEREVVRQGLLARVDVQDDPR